MCYLIIPLRVELMMLLSIAKNGFNAIIYISLIEISKNIAHYTDLKAIKPHTTRRADGLEHFFSLSFRISSTSRFWYLIGYLIWHI